MKNTFVYMFVGFLVSIILYLIVGSGLSVEYLVSISLVVIGATWSYLALEVNQVKQLRDEYFYKVKEVEESCFVLIENTSEAFIKAAFYNPSKRHEIEEYAMLLSEKKMQVGKNFNIFIYKLMKLSNDQFENRDFEPLEKEAKELFEKFSSSVSDVVLKLKPLSEEDETIISTKQTNILSLMVSYFSNKTISFEEFSNEYESKKNVCVSIVCICFFIVVFKSIDFL
ncbi:MAG: hypothetical protein IKE45_16550 [Halomonas sp.]|nr:hypothetical protein [Halomonas sp.]MBR2515588.1 hypothetical protein [Halomonas sp.]